MFNFLKNRKELKKEYESFKNVYSILIAKDGTIYCLYGDNYKTAYYKNMETGTVINWNDRDLGNFYNIKDLGFIEGKKVIEIAQKHEIFNWILKPSEEINDLLLEMFIVIQKKQKEFFNRPEIKKITKNYNDFYFIEEQIEEFISEAIEKVYPNVWEWMDDYKKIENFEMSDEEMMELEEFQKQHGFQDLNKAIVFSAIKKYIGL